MRPSVQEWESFYTKFRSKTGLDLFQYKPDQLRRRVVGMAESKQCSTLDQFWDFLSKSQDNVQWFQDKLAINVSELFRNPEKWREIESTILPELLKRSSTLKVWSAGCSYGAEAHTLATIFEAKFPGRHQIIGTDIDQEALTQARKGEFNDADMRSVPAEWRTKHFTKSGAVWTANPEIRKYCTFKTGDLLKDSRESGYDLIMCRNVVIYFTDEAKDKLYERFFAALKPGGILFVGSTERIFRSREIGFETSLPFFYKKPLHGERTWRNAS